MEEQQRHWFPAKKYGYGWGLPVVWQGWALLLGYLGLVAAAGLAVSGGTDLLWFLPLHLVLTGLFLFVVWKKGEKTTWRRGDKQ